MSIVKINNKTYEVPELNFAHSKKLEQYGVPLLHLIDTDKILTIVSAFVAIVVGVTPEEADFLIEQHILGGGSIEDIYKAYVDAVSESRFLKRLIENQKKNVTKKTSKVEQTE